MAIFPFSFLGSLARRLKEDGPLGLEMLPRFGVDLLQTIDELERLGITHRDIKPDNLGVRSVKNGPLQLVLFDFSLTTAPAEDIRLGTPPYLDPFLSLRKTPRWDHHAERFGAAMTLYEMTCGSGVFPLWGDGDGGSAPHLIDAEVRLRPELFPEFLREGLVVFFRKALARQVKDRFDNNEEMLTAWRHIFEKIDQPAVKPTATEENPHGDQPSLAEILKTATPDMQLVLLGRSVRLMNVLDRLEVVTIADLLRYPIGRLRRMRGVGYKTSQKPSNSTRLSTSASQTLSPGSASTRPPRMPHPNPISPVSISSHAVSSSQPASWRAVSARSRSVSSGGELPMRTLPLCAGRARPIWASKSMSPAPELARSSPAPGRNGSRTHPSPACVRRSTPPCFRRAASPPTSS